MKKRCKTLFVALVIALVSQSCSSFRPEAFGPGDIVGTADGMSITLEKAQVSESKLTADFLIDNSHGTKDQRVSAAVNFSAKDADGNALELTPCGGPSMDGIVLAGDQRRGQICWKVAEEGAKLKIYFHITPGDPSAAWEAN